MGECPNCKRAEEYVNMRVGDALRAEFTFHYNEHCYVCFLILKRVFKFKRLKRFPDGFPVGSILRELCSHELDNCCACAYLVGVVSKMYNLVCVDGVWLPKVGAKIRVRNASFKDEVI